MALFTPVLTQAFTAFVVNTVLSAFVTIRGPKIGDIAAQTSQEGVPRPIVFGTSPPIAGNIIAASDPIKITRSKRSGFLGIGPKIKTEHVFRTYAIGICEGPIQGIIRVWRNGKLIFDVADQPAPITEASNVLEVKALEVKQALRDRKSINGKMRFYLGDYDQLPDPALEAVFGVGNVPAHRGTAYMVMEDEELTDLGGAIPQWMFQVGTGASSELIMMRPSGLKRSLDGGTTWVDENPPTLSGVTLNRVAYSPIIKRLVGIQTSTHSPQVIRYSDDGGLTWHPAQNPAPPGTFPMGGIMWSPTANIFVVPHAGEHANARIAMYSADGSNWSITPTPPVSLNGVNSIVQVDDRIVVYFNNRVCWSTDGISWSHSAISQTLFNPGSAAYSPKLGVIVLASGNANTRWVSKTDLGTINTASPNPGMINNVAWSSSLGRFANNAFNPWYSSDGKAWQEAGPDQTGTTRVTIWSPLARRFINSGDVSGPTTVRIYTSDDGIEWTLRNSTGSYQGSALIEIGGFSATGGIFLDELVSALCERVGLDSEKIDVSRLSGRVYGLVVTNAYPVYEVLRSLSQVFFFDPSNYDGKIHFIPRGGNSVATITEDDMVDDGGEIEQERRQDSISIPRVLHLNYHDIAGGLNPDKQSSERAGDRRSNGEVSIQSPVVMDANTAARVIDKAHKVMIEDQKGELRISLSDKWLKLTVADPVILQYQGRSERCRITKCDIGDGLQEYTLLRDRQSAYTSNVEGIPAAPVTPVAPTTPGATLLEALDIPPITSEDAERVGVYVAISGILPAWQGALIELSFDGGQNYTDSADWNLSAVMGETLTVLNDHPQAYPDQTNTVRVRIDTPGGALTETDLQGLLNRQNLAIIGNEIIQFANAEEVDEGEWELSYLLRGRRHTQTESHPVGSRFVLLDDSLPFVPIDIAYLNQTITLRATSYGLLPESGTVVSFTFNANTQREFPVGYLQAHRDGNDAVITWQGAGRVGAGVTASQGTKFIGYRVTITDGSLTQTFDTIQQELTQDVSAFSSPLTIRVQQRNQLTGLGPQTEVILP